MSHLPRVSYQQGDHICTLYSNRDEQIAAAVNYIRGGLEGGERCLYVCCDQTPDEFRACLAAAGIDAAAEEARGALVLLTRHEGHLQGGTFDPDRMISLLEAAVRDALQEGFNGLRAAGDMSWLLDEAPGSQRVAEYEARLNEFYPSQRALGLCQYDRTKLPTAALNHGIASHSHIRLAGNILLENPFYEQPSVAAKRAAEVTRTKMDWFDRLRRVFGSAESSATAAPDPAAD